MVMWLLLLFVLGTHSQQYVKLPAANPKSGPVLTLHNFTTSTGAEGRVAVVHRPIGKFHVYYPVNASSQCDGLELTSVQSAKHQCWFATNGGPFSYHSPTCIGDIVSDGTTIQVSGSSRGQAIGLTRDHNWIFGTVSPSEIKSLGFLQLTSAFDWLTKDGKVLPAAGGLIAPRTFAGINNKGELLLFVVDGTENPPLGLTLQQAAHLALKWGCNYSINLDGGGSSVACSLGKIISKPTCHDVPTVCERKVTTVTCITA